MTYAMFKARTGWIAAGLHWLLAAMPLLWLALVYGYAVRAKSILGYWPAPCHPDPKTQELIGIRSFYELTWAVGDWSFWAWTGFILLIPACRFLNGQRRLVFRSWACAGIYAAAFAWICVDPGRFLEWFFD